MKRLASALVSVLLTAVCSIDRASSSPNSETPRVALLPGEDASAAVKNNRPFEIYPEKELGKETELVATTDYSSVIEAMHHDRIDTAYFGPLSYVLVGQKSDIEPFTTMRRKGSTTYQSVLVANVDAGIARINDIVSRNAAYGGRASTSNHLIPKLILTENGLKTGENYREYFAGIHDMVTMAAQNDRAQIGGLSKPIFESLVQRGLVDPSKMKVLTESKPYPWCLRVMHSNLRPELEKKIRAASLSLRGPEALKPFRAGDFDPVSDKDYDMARGLGTLLKFDLSRS